MSISKGISPLSELSTLDFGTPLAMVSAEIVDVFRLTTLSTGTHQLIRVLRGGVPIDVQVYDQQSIPQSCTGGIVRITANPHASKPSIVWERCKAAKPTMKIGTIAVRKNARLEFYSMGEAAAAGVNVVGFVRADTSESVAPQQKSAPAATKPPLPTEPVKQPVQLPLPPAQPQTAAAAPATPPPALLPLVQDDDIALARAFGGCLSTARAALGPDAKSEDIQATARVIFDRKYPRATAA